METPVLNKLKQLPRGNFEINSEEYGLVKGRFCILSLTAFSKKREIEFSELVDYLLRPERTTFEETLKLIADLFLCAIEYQYQKEGTSCPYNEIHVYELAEEVGITEANLYLTNVFVEAFEPLAGNKKKLEVMPKKGKQNGSNSN